MEHTLVDTHKRLSWLQCPWRMHAAASAVTAHWMRLLVAEFGCFHSDDVRCLSRVIFPFALPQQGMFGGSCCGWCWHE